MCGIVGIVGGHDVIPSLMNGLKRLEYRGYDSAGVAAIEKDGSIFCARAKGKLHALDQKLKKGFPQAQTGIGHTRWATHGIPAIHNAHPHSTRQAAVIHNGIIENFTTLREELKKQGHQFKSSTDTEVIPLLLTHFLQQGHTPQQAVPLTLKKLEGSFALAIIFAGYPDLLIVARKGSPLAIGQNGQTMYVASDAYALAPFTNNICYLQDGDWAEIHPARIQIYNQQGQKINRQSKQTTLLNFDNDRGFDDGGKGSYRHFMLKEIYEQPQALAKTLSNMKHIAEQQGNILSALFPDVKNVSQITLIACGTSFYAAMVAKYWLEQLAKIAVRVEIASEFRYSNPILPDHGLTVLISQSGETADTLAALRYAKQSGQRIVSILNTRESSMERESDAVLHTLAGPEIGVASTKAFTTQLAILAMLALDLAQHRKTLTTQRVEQYQHMLAELPNWITEILDKHKAIAALAKSLASAKNVLYMGRGNLYPIALEGALKLKEISYIHAEGIAAGELKHGPIALIDEHTPVVVCATEGALLPKIASNIEEVIARGGKVWLFSTEQGIQHLADKVTASMTLPTVDEMIAPILYAVPMQLLAYYVAVTKGTDVDQPRNLAKSVTVE